MQFEDLDQETQESILEMLKQRVEACAESLAEDGSCIPILFVPDANLLIGLMAEDGETDVDIAYELAIERLKQLTFSYASFSYSTQLVSEKGKVIDALKTYVFTANGIEVTFFTTYTRKGLFKKKLAFGETFLHELKENVL